MQEFIWSDLSQAEKTKALERPASISDAKLMSAVEEILSGIKTGGDAALRRYTKQFDGVEPAALKVEQCDLAAAWSDLPDIEKSAIDRAKANIKKFHIKQIPQTIEVETEFGVLCRRIPKAIDVAGLYVPGGTAPLISTLLMLAIPAKIAGVDRRVVTSPPGKDGKINSAVLAAAYRCDVTDVYIAGGAQAIAALAYGTETIPKCAKIFGPGNAWVAAAKSIVSQRADGPAIDMPAGPSEAMVLCDAASNPAFIASDLLSQAEHDTQAQVMCVATTAKVAQAVVHELEKQLSTLPRRDIAQASLKLGRMIITSKRSEIIDIVNRYAPEHLIVQLQSPESYVADIQNAGSVFLGPWTPESVGDYASGTNHTLPTYGAARAYSGVSTESFMKFMTVQALTEQGLQNLGPTVERLAEMEGLDAHKRAVSLRLEAIAEKSA